MLKSNLSKILLKSVSDFIEEFKNDNCYKSWGKSKIKGSYSYYHGRCSEFYKIT